jgi:hypothetical protein
MQGQGDRALDAEIKNAIAGVGGGKLSEKAANRAKRQISIILNSKDEIPLEIKVTCRHHKDKTSRKSSLD